MSVLGNRVLRTEDPGMLTGAARGAARQWLFGFERGVGPRGRCGGPVRVLRFTAGLLFYPGVVRLSIPT